VLNGAVLHERQAVERTLKEYVMDTQRFDQVTKQLSRRRLTKGLLAGAAAGVVALLGSQQGNAQRSCGQACAQGSCSNLSGRAKGLCIRDCIQRECQKEELVAGTEDPGTLDYRSAGRGVEGCLVPASPS
jgi:hypothetical protein